MTIFLRKISFYLALLGIATMASLVKSQNASVPMPSPPVAPAAKPYARGLGASGLVEARHENTQLGVPSAGLVLQVHAAVWDKVKKGQALLQMDDRELCARLESERAQVGVAEATAKRARDQLERLERVARAQAGAVAEEELTTRRNDAAVAAAQIQVARATVAATEALVERLVVRSPIDATILQVNVRPGEFVTPSVARPPLVLGHIGELQVRADIDEQIAPRFVPGSRATGYLKGDSSRPIPMEFVRVEPFVIPKVSLTGGSSERVDTRVLQVIYSFPNPGPDHPVYVGQQMDVFIEEPPATPARPE